MFKALGTLAVCMIGGALLLAWLEPPPRDYATGGIALGDRVDTGDLRSLARRVVRTAVAAPRRPWNGVEIVAVTQAGPGNAVTLAATSPPAGFHFLVGRDGRFRSLSPWRRQQPASGEARVIRIGLTGTSASARVSAAQWTALRVLLAELAGQTGSAAGGLPVHLAPLGADTDADPSPFVQHLQNLLAREGLLG